MAGEDLCGAHSLPCRCLIHLGEDLWPERRRGNTTSRLAVLQSPILINCLVALLPGEVNPVYILRQFCFFRLLGRKFSEEIGRNLAGGDFNLAVTVMFSLQLKHLNCAKPSFTGDEGISRINALTHNNGVEQPVGTDAVSKISQ